MSKQSTSTQRVKTTLAALLIAALTAFPGSALAADEPPAHEGQEEVQEETWWDPILQIWVTLKTTATGAKIEGDG